MSPSLLHRARLDLCLSGCQFLLAAVMSGHRYGLKTAQICHPVSEIPYPLGTGTCIPSGGMPYPALSSHLCALASGPMALSSESMTEPIPPSHAVTWRVSSPDNDVVPTWVMLLLVSCQGQSQAAWILSVTATLGKLIHL